MTKDKQQSDSQATATEESESNLMVEKQLCFSLYSAANAIIRAYRPMLLQIDLTYPQYLVMMVLWSNNGINVKELGNKLHLDSGTLTPLLKRLDNKGLVDRRRSESDERVREIYLTQAGTDLKSSAEKIPRAMYCKANLELEELLTLKGMCDKLVDNLGE